MKREEITWSRSLPSAKLVFFVLAKGNGWVYWWPYGMKMSGYCPDVTAGRAVEVRLP